MWRIHGVFIRVENACTQRNVRNCHRRVLRVRNWARFGAWSLESEGLNINVYGITLCVPNKSWLISCITSRQPPRTPDETRRDAHTDAHTEVFFLLRGYTMLPWRRSHGQNRQEKLVVKPTSGRQSQPRHNACMLQLRYKTRLDISSLSHDTKPFIQTRTKQPKPGGSTFGGETPQHTALLYCRN